MHQFSILTPTYNRANYLPKIHACLCQQGDIDLEWIIIDDGSSDNTKEIVSGFKNKFEIKYSYQENAGKPTAHNKYMLIADSYISKMQDSDDILCPDILKEVWNYFNIETGKFQNGCACISGLCQYEDGNIIGDKFPYDFFISDYINYKENKHINGDKSDFYVTSILKNYPFPIIEDEKNIPPSIIHSRIALTNKTIFVNKVFEEKKFLENGLSSQNYLFKYTKGAELFYNEKSVPPYRLKLQIKHSAKYIYFCKKNNGKAIFKNAKNKTIFPLGLCAYYVYLVLLFIKKFAHFQKKKHSKIFTSE